MQTRTRDPGAEIAGGEAVFQRRGTAVDNQHGRLGHAYNLMFAGGLRFPDWTGRSALLDRALRRESGDRSERTPRPPGRERRPIW